jgi:indole-3-glycerol phosphate synthase
MSVLASICESKKHHVAQRRAALPFPELEARLVDVSPPRGFLARLEAVRVRAGHAVIAEFKRASPAKGLIRESADPAAIAALYETAGAACLSVLTDTPYFQGRDEDLEVARAACALPVLRKDFIVDPYQIYESRMLGADCILLIMAALNDETAEDFLLTAQALGMDVLVEVHDRAEMDRALSFRPAIPALIGINNRNLQTLEVSLETGAQLGPLVPAGSLAVAESGIAARADLDTLKAAGFGAFLVGESLMRAPDPFAALSALV